MNIFLVLALGALAACSTPEAGCLIYGQHRNDIPPLGTDAVSQWVDILDGAMTGGCRR